MAWRIIEIIGRTWMTPPMPSRHARFEVDGNRTHATLRVFTPEGGAFVSGRVTLRRMAHEVLRVTGGADVR